MKMKASRSGCQAFTLIELMVVVAIIAILIGGEFQLMSTVGAMNQKSVTQARMQRLQNAISGFYAEYGYYPPVSQYTSPDPWGANLKTDFNQSIQNTSTEAGFAQACSFSAACQPVSFEFPPVIGLDPYINKTYQQWNMQSPNSFLGSTADTIPQDEWLQIKLFKFGLLSFLLPRVELVGFTGKNSNQSLEPDTRFYESRQWKKNNPVSNVSSTRKALESQQIIENRAVARWLPNLEGIVANGRILLGIDTHEANTAGDEGGYRTHSLTDAKGAVVDVLGYEYNGQKYVLQYVTLRDGWGRELYYYSAPPYQSFRIWSAGKDGRTFPPWIPMNSLSNQERIWASDWVKDDIVRFDR